MSELEVRATGPYSSIQDLGRPGFTSLGVGTSGAADPTAMRLANRLLGNQESAATIEVTLGGLELACHGGVWAALTGAPCPVVTEWPNSTDRKSQLDGQKVLTRRAGTRRVAGVGAPFWVPDGAQLRVGTPASGLRSYLAVRGGIGVTPVLGSRSTDTLSGIGPGPLAPGVRLPVGVPTGSMPGVDLAPVALPSDGEVVLRVSDGPRADWFTADARRALTEASWEVSAESDRIGMRLTGPELGRTRTAELPSEPMVLGALQVPPSGQPTLFLADHPVTGGYPVIAVVRRDDIGRAAQARPGERIRFTRRSH